MDQITSYWKARIDGQKDRLMETIERAIELNRNRAKYRRIAHKLRLNVFEYEDAGKAEKAARVLAKCIKRGIGKKSLFVKR